MALRILKRENPEAKDLVTLSDIVQPGAQMNDGSYYIGTIEQLGSRDLFVGDGTMSLIGSARFADAANQRNLHGHSDWRLPTADEARQLLSLPSQALLAMGIIPYLRSSQEAAEQKADCKAFTKRSTFDYKMGNIPIVFGRNHTGVSMRITTSTFNASADGTVNTGDPLEYHVEHYTDGTHRIIEKLGYPYGSTAEGVVVRDAPAQAYKPIW